MRLKWRKSPLILRFSKMKRKTQQLLKMKTHTFVVRVMSSKNSIFQCTQFHNYCQINQNSRFVILRCSTCLKRRTKTSKRMQKFDNKIEKKNSSTRKPNLPAPLKNLIPALNKCPNLLLSTASTPQTLTSSEPTPSPSSRGEKPTRPLSTGTCWNEKHFESCADTTNKLLTRCLSTNPG